MAQAVEDRRDREPLEEGVEALIDQMAGAAPALENDPGSTSNGAPIVDPPRSLAESNGASDHPAASIDPTAREAEASAPSAAGTSDPPIAAPPASTPDSPQPAIAAQDEIDEPAVPPLDAASEAIAHVAASEQPPDPRAPAEPSPASPNDSDSPPTGVDEAMQSASAALAEPLDGSLTDAPAPTADAPAPQHESDAPPATAATPADPAATPTEAIEPARDLAGAVSQLIDSTKESEHATPSTPSPAAPAASPAPERIDSLDAALAGQGDELIAGEFADENSVLTGAPQEPEDAPPLAESPTAPEQSASLPARAPAIASAVATVAARGLASDAGTPTNPRREGDRHSTDSIVSPPIAAPPPKPSIGAIATRLSRPITSRLAALAKAALYSMSAPLQGRPKHVRDAVAWMALLQGFFAVCVWGYIVVRPKEARPPEGPIAAPSADGHGAAKDSHGKASDGHGAPKKDSHGAAKKAPPKKDSHASAKKEPASKAKKAKDSHGGH